MIHDPQHTTPANPPDPVDYERRWIRRGLPLFAAFICLLGLVWISWPKPKPVKPLEIPLSELVLKDGRLYVRDQSNPFTGVMVEFYPDGLLKSRSILSNGLLYGLSEGYFTNGQVQVKEQFQNGVSHGLRIKYYPDGSKMSEAMIVEGQLHGTFRRWHENGVLAEQIEMQKGNPNGLAEAFYPSGYLKAESTMENGKLVIQHQWPDGEHKK